MKVVVTSEGNRMDDAVDPRFGRAPTLLLTDTETGGFEAVSNEAAMRGSGAGIGTAETAVKLGAHAVVTGRVGPKASQVLEAAHVPVYVGASGSVQEALDAFKAGRLKRFDEKTPGTKTKSGRGGGRRRSARKGAGPGRRH